MKKIKEDVLHISETDTDQAYAFGEFTTSGPIAVYKDLTLTELLATKGINKAHWTLYEFSRK